MKKILFLTAILALAAGFLFTACTKKDEETSKTYSYTIYLEPETVTWSNPIGDSSDGFSEWMNSILDPVKKALGATGDTFSLTGTLEECNKKVETICKGLEPVLSKVKGGTGTLSIVNNNTQKTVYSYRIQA